MADTTTKPEDKKTVVAFIVGLLIGGLLVWAFSGPTAGAPSKMDNEKKGDNKEEVKADDKEEAPATETTEEAATPAPTLAVGEGKVELGEVPAGTSVAIPNVTYPVSEGWVGVRSYQDDRLGMILGVVRFSKDQGLVPEAITLQTPMRAGAQYAVVMFTEDGDRKFNLAADKQVDQIFATFTAK